METGRSDGLLLVDKPAGMTSHDAVNRVRRALGERRIGHAGTLDPFATGLLVMMVGRATRLLPYVEGEPKVYEATIRFGVATDTDDLTGVPIATGPRPGRDAVDAAIARLTGRIDQLPPAYSAKQVAGRRAYSAARRGEALALAPSGVDVHGWRVHRFDGEELDVTVTVGGGTYVRALARDLGASVGSAAHLTKLRRIRSGVASVEQAVALDEVSPLALRAPLDAMPSLPRVALNGPDIARVGRGMPVAAVGGDRRCALVDGAGELVAIAARDGDHWQPRVVLRDG
jgi:tRNA pseudouridine55 synthase